MRDTAQPLFIEHHFQQCGAEGTGEMGPAFGPVEAGAGEIAPLLLEGGDVDALLFEPAAALLGEFELLLMLDEEFMFDEAFGQLHSYPAGEMIIAGATGADGRVLFFGGLAGLSRHEGGERFDGIRHFWAGVGIITMAALGFDCKEIGFYQFGQVHAAIGGGGVDRGGEFGGGVSATVEEGPEDVGADGVADELRDIVKHRLKC